MPAPHLQLAMSRCFNRRRRHARAEAKAGAPPRPCDAAAGVPLQQRGLGSRLRFAQQDKVKTCRANRGRSIGLTLTVQWNMLAPHQSEAIGSSGARQEGPPMATESPLDAHLLQRCFNNLPVLAARSAAYAASNLAKNSVGPNQIKARAVDTSKLADNAVTTGKIADNAVTGQKVKVSSLHFTCNNPVDATLILGGPCVYKRTTGGSTWIQAIQTCQMGVGGATLPTVAQVEAYAPLGGTPLEERHGVHLGHCGDGSQPIGRLGGQHPTRMAP